MKQSYYQNTKPLKIVQGKANHVADKKMKSTDPNRQTTTPSQNKTLNSQFEVKIQKRSISFFEDNRIKQTAQQLFSEDQQSSGTSSPDTHNIWESECKCDNLFDLFLSRYQSTFGNHRYNENTSFTKAIQSFKKLYGYNLSSKNIGFQPFFYSKIMELNHEKFKENICQPKGLPKFRLNENRVPFGNISSFHNQANNINNRYQK